MTQLASPSKYGTILARLWNARAGSHPEPHVLERDSTIDPHFHLCCDALKRSDGRYVARVTIENKLDRRQQTVLIPAIAPFSSRKVAEEFAYYYAEIWLRHRLQSPNG